MFKALVKKITTPRQRDWLGYLLERNGFTACEEYPHEPHFVPGAQDASLVKEPFGEFLSLNMVATRL